MDPTPDYLETRQMQLVGLPGSKRVSNLDVGGRLLGAVLGEKLTDALSFEIPRLTLRQLQVSRIPQKARAVIGMRRSGKTWFLFQQMLEGMALGVPRDRLMYFNFEDERLGDQSVDQLSWLLEEYYRRVPHARALREAQRPDDRLLVLSLTEEFLAAGVAVTPTWKWLLEGDPSI